MGSSGGSGSVAVRLLDGVHLVVVGSEELALRGERQRALLARLALDCGSAVSRDVLIEDVWNGSPGRSATSGLRVQIKRLRDHLEPHGLDGIVETTGDGYRLSDEVTTDADRLASVVDDAVAGRIGSRALCERFAEVAVGLSGEPLMGLEDLAFAVTAGQRLRRLQTRALTWYARACLSDGRADEAETLSAAAAERAPLDEGVAAIRMQALVALGRNREALLVAHRLRLGLAEVGLEPGPEVRSREQDILNPAPTAPRSRSVGIAGRQFEIQRILEALDGIAIGIGSTVTISGPAGIGKTELARFAIQGAVERGWDVATTIADEMERHRPFHLLFDVQLQRPDEPPRSLDLGTALIADPHRDAPTGFDPASLRLVVAAKLNEMLDNRPDPMVIVAEDLHWADESSLAIVRALSRSARHRPLMLVLTGRLETDWLGVLGDAPRQDVFLGPLADDDAQLLAQERVGGSLGPELASAVASAAGNPLLVVEYLRGLQMEDRLIRIGDVVDSSGGGPPTNVRALANRRLNALSEPARTVLETAAVVGRVCDLDLLTRLCDTRRSELMALLETSTRVGIVSFDDRRVTYLHDLFREAVYAQIPDARRAELHRAVARALDATDRPVISVAAHALLSGADNDNETIAWMREAAAAAAAVEPRSTIAFLDRALELSSGVDERFRLLHAKVEALTASGKLPDATQLVDVLVRARRPETSVLQVRYAGLLMAQAKANEAREVLSRVEPESLGEALRSRWGALTALCNYAAFDQEAARAHAERAIDDGTAACDSIGLSMAHGVVGRCDVMAHRYLDGLAAGRLSAEYADADPTGGAHLYLPWYFVGMTLLDLDDHGGVEDALERGRSVSARHHLHFSWPLYSTLETALAQRIGDLDRAFRAGVEVLEIDRQLGYTLISAWVRALLSLCALERTELDLAETYCREAEAAQAAGSPQGAHVVALARAELERTNGNMDRAFEVLDEHWRFFDAFSLHACKPWIAPALARAAVQTGRSGTARAVASELALVTERSSAAAHRATRNWVDGLIAGSAETVLEAARDFAAIGRSRDAALAAGDATALRTRR